MKSLLKGIASFDHILTEEDVLRQNGLTDSGLTDSASLEISAHLDSPALPSAPVEPPASVPEPPAPDPVDPPASVPELSDEDLATKLEAENTKAALVAMAEAAGIEQSGNKAEISSRLVSHYRSQK